MKGEKAPADHLQCRQNDSSPTVCSGRRPRVGGRVCPRGHTRLIRRPLRQRPAWSQLRPATAHDRKALTINPLSPRCIPTVLGVSAGQREEGSVIRLTDGSRVPPCQLGPDVSVPARVAVVTAVPSPLLPTAPRLGLRQPQSEVTRVTRALLVVDSPYLLHGL